MSEAEIERLNKVYSKMLDTDLLEVLENSKDYTKIALEIAKGEIERRGGVNQVKENIRKTVDTPPSDEKVITVGEHILLTNEIRVRLFAFGFSYLSS